MFETIFRNVRAISQIHPELRFTQIITMAANRAGWKENDLFYCTNEMIEKGLEILVKEQC